MGEKYAITWPLSVEFRLNRPWRVITVIEFPNQQSAMEFERYLKSGSGRAFARRHFE